MRLKNYIALIFRITIFFFVYDGAAGKARDRLYQLSNFYACTYYWFT